MEIAIKPVLWNYKKIIEAKRNLTVGEHEVRICMTQARVPKYMTTGFGSSAENWNTTDGYPESTHPKYKELLIWSEGFQRRR